MVLIIETGHIVILIAWTYSELFNGYFRIMLTSSIVVCNDSDITWILAEHIITDRITIEIGSRRVRPDHNSLHGYKNRHKQVVFFCYLEDT